MGATTFGNMSAWPYHPESNPRPLRRNRQVDTALSPHQPLTARKPPNTATAGRDELFAPTKASNAGRGETAGGSLGAQRCAAVHGDGRDGRGGSHRGRRWAGDPPGSR